MNQQDASRPTLPFVWSHPIERTGPERGGQRVPFDPLAERFRGVGGIVSGIDGDGVRWLRASMTPANHNVRLILAVYPGCPTLARHLAELLDIQTNSGTRIRFRVLPVTRSVDAPANSLVAIPKDQSNSVLVFGATPNFGIVEPDATHINIAFRADPALSDSWCRWFNRTWNQAAPLDGSTVDIPFFPPVAGSSEAAHRWKMYCESCTQQQPEESITSIDRISSESGRHSVSDNEDGQTASESIGLHELDSVAERMTKIFGEGLEARVVRAARTANPFELPIDPKFFAQSAEHREQDVVHRQSFSISVFSKDDIQVMSRYRRAIKMIIKKLGILIDTGRYWMPHNVISIHREEVTQQFANCERELIGLFASNHSSYSAGKREAIRRGIEKINHRLGNRIPMEIDSLTKVLDESEEKIQKAIESATIETLAYINISIDLCEKNDTFELSWEQAEKLLLSLARFPRDAILNPNAFSGLFTNKQRILDAMNVLNDNILRSERVHRQSVIKKSKSELQIIDRIAGSSITARDRCEAYFMIIDGDYTEKIDGFIKSKSTL